MGKENNSRELSPFDLHRMASSFAREADEKFSRIQDDIKRGIKVDEDEIVQLHLSVTHANMVCDDFDDMPRRNIKLSVDKIRELLKAISDDMRGFRLDQS